MSIRRNKKYGKKPSGYLGCILAELRDKAKLSRAQMCQKLGKNPLFALNAETGKGVINFSNLVSWVKAAPVLVEDKAELLEAYLLTCVTTHKKDTPGYSAARVGIILDKLRSDEIAALKGELSVLSGKYKQVQLQLATEGKAGQGSVSGTYNRSPVVTLGI